MKRKQVPEAKVVRARELLRPFTKASFLQKLKEKMAEIDALQKMSHGNESFQLWRNSAETLLVHALGDEVAQTEEFKKISYWPPLIVSGMAESVYQESYASGLQRARTALQSIYDEVKEYFDDQNIEQKQVVERQTLPLGKEVFVVHGHDNEMLLKVKEFLTKSGLHPIVLREQPNEGRTIIEKFENEAASTGFAVVLLTPDDVGRDVNEANGENPRARQNVVFEMGYFIGKFGRRKVAAICDPSVERPGDVAGVVYIDSTSGNDWKIALMKELRAAGYDVDPSALLA